MWVRSLSLFLWSLIFISSTIISLADAEDDEKLKVVIVGAGAAGLHAAYELNKAGIKDIVVLEARDRIGGRIHSMSVNGKWIELGAQWIHGQEENPLWLFVQEHKIPIADEADRGGEGKFVRDDGNLMPKDLLEDTIRTLEDFKENPENCEKWGKMQDDEDEAKSIGDFFDEELTNWLSKSKESEEEINWRKQLYRWWVKIEETDAGSDNLYNQSSLSWCDYDEIEPDTSFKDGYQSLLNVYNQEVGDKVKLNTKVIKIMWQESDGSVQVETENGNVFKADHVIVTSSLGYLKKHHKDLFNPALPEITVSVIEALKMGTVTKIFLDFESPFWDEEDPGYQFLWQGDEEEKIKRNENWIQQLIGLDIVMNQPNMLLGWIAGEAARYVETLEDKEVGDTVVAHLTKIVRALKKDPEFQLPELRQVIVTRHYSDPLSLGTYSYRELDSDELGISHTNMSEPVLFQDSPKILFAGEATINEFFGTVHGAMESATRQVQFITKNESED